MIESPPKEGPLTGRAACSGVSKAAAARPTSRGVRLSERLAFRPAEVAKVLGVCERTVRKWMRDEGLPFMRLDGVVLIPSADLQQWMSERVTGERQSDQLTAEILDGLSKHN